MTADAAERPVRRPARSPGPALYVVRAIDSVDERIAGHDGRTYTSPPQPHKAALTLAGLLLGGAIGHVNGGAPCTQRVAIAGGRRTVTVEPADPRGDRTANQDPEEGGLP
jgi:hypothetical protein